MKKLSKTEAKKKIGEFFKKEKLRVNDVKKIRRLAMHHSIKLGRLRARFCKKCLTDLKSGKVRLTKTHKIIECVNCGFRNKIRTS